MRPLIPLLAAAILLSAGCIQYTPTADEGDRVIVSLRALDAGGNATTAATGIRVQLTGDDPFGPLFLETFGGDRTGARATLEGHVVSIDRWLGEQERMVEFDRGQVEQVLGPVQEGDVVGPHAAFSDYTARVEEVGDGTVRFWILAEDRVRSELVQGGQALDLVGEFGIRLRERVAGDAINASFDPVVGARVSFQNPGFLPAGQYLVLGANGDQVHYLRSEPADNGTAATAKLVRVEPGAGATGDGFGRVRD